jgi:uncharacterized repeat protein (TIGR01451 family)
MKLVFTLLLFSISICGFSQAGKDGSLTVTATNTVLNRYTRVTADIAAGSRTVTVSNINDLNRDGIGYLGTYVTNASVYASNALSHGDLIILYQAQGATIDITNTLTYGSVTSFNGAGYYELAYVESVAGNVITLGCNATLSYIASRYVQLIRVPQYTTLTINSGASVSAIPWGYPSFGGADASAAERRRGGFVTVVANNVVNNGSINANEAGFRGGTIDNNTSTEGATIYSDYVTTNDARSAEKGEGIAGYRTDYDALNGRYGRGAPANGGGGGNAHNAGGGGGANGGVLANWFRGAGVMNSFGTCGSPGAWTLDADYIAATPDALSNSSGGGRGGYSYGANNGNACTLAPSNSGWGGDYRDPVGGLGGRPVTSGGYGSQIFMGGGGGAGDGNNNANADGGDGGGIVFLVLTGNVTGTGTIESNGQNGFNTVGGNNDAPGGGGGGGTVLIQANSIPNTQTVRANGGSGGNQLTIGNESEGPGGGGGGGVISINATTDNSTKTVAGGANGTTVSTALTEFPANGATSGNTGSILSIAVDLKYEMCQTDVGVTMSVASACAAVGNNVTFTITATNNGSLNASGVNVTDALPSGYTYVSSTPSTGTYTSGTGVWAIGILASGASQTLTITATVKATGIYLNTSTVAITQTDTNSSNNTASTIIILQNNPVLTADAVAVCNGSATNINVQTINDGYTYQIKRQSDNSNLGASFTGDGTTFSRTTGNLSTGETYYVTISNGSCSHNGTNTKAVTVSALPVAGSITGGTSVCMGSTLSLTSNATGTPTLTYTWNSSNTGVATVSNTGVVNPVSAGSTNITYTVTDGSSTACQATSANYGVSITNCADLAVTKTVDNSTPSVGSNVTFTITATNNGFSAATGVKVTEALPSGYTYVSDNSGSTGTTYNSGTGVWSIGSMAKDATKELKIVAKVL